MGVGGKMIGNCLLLLVSMDGLATSKRTCQNSEYLDIRKDTCFPCSTECPDNHVVRRTCGPYNDMQCGTLVELSDFFQNLSNGKSKDTLPTAHPWQSIHVASVGADAQENDVLLHVLLMVLLLLTGLIIVLTVVALVMYRRRNSHTRKIADPENDAFGSCTVEVVTVKSNSDTDRDNAALTSALLKAEK